MLGAVLKLVLAASAVTSAGIAAVHIKEDRAALYMSSETRIFDIDSPYYSSGISEFSDILSKDTESDTVSETGNKPADSGNGESVYDEITDTSDDTLSEIAETGLPSVPVLTEPETDVLYETEEASFAEPTEITVYWVKSGEVWHISEKCPSLSRSKSILSGTVDEAMASGKARVCKRCGG